MHGTQAKGRIARAGQKRQMRLFQFHLLTDHAAQVFNRILTRAKVSVFAEMSHKLAVDDITISIDSVYVDVTPEGELNFIPVPSAEATSRGLQAMHPDDALMTVMSLTKHLGITIEHTEAREMVTVEDEEMSTGV